MTIFISVGDDVHSGGPMLFYLKRKNGELELVLAISHSDGRWVYAPFSTVLHEGTPWVGKRGVFSAIVSLPVYRFFELHTQKQHNVVINKKMTREYVGLLFIYQYLFQNSQYFI